ncbi:MULTISPECIES: PAS domain S-box protein [Sorangium]|uniref:Anti-anti sigma factor protein n=1 Tax=Sorangium cellulosum (strain So ce56) TaxID=448385 RepID=A9GAE6_SORC5|nr:PAS domain S-box protein [Sorangium cellulosum]CAN92854.1 anti-anti sigma factor protein [Sorangium cellulosum So ce56]
MNESHMNGSAAAGAELEMLRRRNAELEGELVERRRVETALRASEARFRAIVEGQTELICRFRPDGTLTFVNEVYCRFFDKTPEELVGHRFTPLIPEEDQRLLEKQFATVGPENPILHTEHRVLCPDGSVRWLRWTNRAPVGDEGLHAEFQSIGVDVTERRRAEDEVRRLNRELEQLVRELSTPLMPVADQVIAMPLVGFLDAARAAAALETLLQGVTTYNARTVVVDITGVGVFDAPVADAMIRLAKAVKLLGAQAVLTGIQPRIAQSLIEQGVGLGDLVTLQTLKEGIAFALRREHRGSRAPAREWAAR